MVAKMVAKIVSLALTGAILAQGCSAYSVQRFGRGGIMSIEFAHNSVYDFSKDGKYLWLSETNCCDLAGNPVDPATLDDSSRPLPRMKWRSRILGKSWNYRSAYRDPDNALNCKRIADRLLQWGKDNHLDAEGRELKSRRPKLTFPATASPIVTAEVRPRDFLEPGTKAHVVLGRFPDDGDGYIQFRAVGMPNDMLLPFGSDLTVSESLQRVASVSSEHFEGEITPLRFSDIDIDFETGSIAFSNEVYVLFKDLDKALGDRICLDVFSTFGFLDNNYFAFVGGTGGRFSFTARDYLFIYGFREKRIVKVFKSHLRFLDEGCVILDIDLALSADEKYLAVRYDGVITVYPFLIDGKVVGDKGAR